MRSFLHCKSSSGCWSKKGQYVCIQNALNFNDIFSFVHSGPDASSLNIAIGIANFGNYFCSVRLR